jgi:hypothetical protein
MRMKQMHRRILWGCLACLLCFTCSIPAFAAETATPANADERRENPPGLESEASETLESGTPEASEEVSLVLITTFIIAISNLFIVINIVKFDSTYLGIHSFRRLVII